MNLFKTIGNAFNGALQTVGLEKRPQPQPQFNYQRPTITPSQLKVAQNVGQSAGVQTPQVIPHAQPAQPIQPHFNFAGNLANNFGKTLEQGAQNFVVNPALGALHGVTRPVASALGGQGINPSKNPIEKALLGGKRIQSGKNEVTNTLSGLGQTFNGPEIIGSGYAAATGHPFNPGGGDIAQEYMNKHVLPQSIPGALGSAVATGVGLAPGGLGIKGISHGVEGALSKVAAANRGLGEGGFVSLGKSAAGAAKGATTPLLKAAQDAVHFPDFMSKAAKIDQNGGTQLKSLAQAQNYFLKHNTKGGIIDPLNPFAGTPGKPLTSTGNKLPAITKGMPAQLGTSPRAKAIRQAQKIAGVFKLNDQGGSARIGTVTGADAAGAALKTGSNIAQKVGGRVINRISSMAPEVGNMLHNVENTHLDLSGQDISNIPNALKLNKNEFAQAVDHVTGAVKSTNPKVVQGANEITSVLQNKLNQRNALKIPGGELQNYFPKSYSNRISKEGTPENIQAVNELIAQGKSPKQASRILGYASNKPLTPDQARSVLRDVPVIRNRRNGNLEMERRLNLTNFQKTPDALLNYLHHSNKRIAEVTHLGLNDNKALRQINNAGFKGANVQELQGLFNTAVNATKHGEGMIGPLRKVRTALAGSKLGLAGISNATQTVNTAAKYGLRNTGKAIFSKPDQQLITKSGAAIEPLLNELRTQSGGLGDKASKVLMPGFNTVEKFNRSTAAQAAINAARKQGVTGEQNLVNAAREGAKSTQFHVNPANLPQWASTPGGRTVAQFRNFAYNQTGFVGNLIKEAGKGNPAPLARYIALTAPAGAAAYYGKQGIGNAIQGGVNAVTGQNPKPYNASPYQTAVGIESAAGGTGLPDTLLRRAGALGKDATATGIRVAGDVGGPAVKTGLDTMKSVGSAIHGDLTPATRTAAGMVPFAGSALSSATPNIKVGKNGLNVTAAATTKGKKLSPATQFARSNQGLQIAGNNIKYRTGNGTITTLNTSELTKNISNPIGAELQKKKMDSTISTVYKQYLDGAVSQQDMNSIFSKLGVNQSRAEIAVVGSLPTDSKAQYFVDALRNKTQNLNDLVTNKVITSSSIASAYNQGLISEEEYNGLKGSLKSSTAVGRLSIAKGNASASRAATNKVLSHRAKAAPKLTSIKTTQAKVPSVKLKAKTIRVRGPINRSNTRAKINARPVSRLTA